MDGQIWFLTRSLQLSSFQAYKLRVTHLYQLKQHNILVSVGQDEPGINPLVRSRQLSAEDACQCKCRYVLISKVHVFAHQVKVWNLDKKDSGSPLCTRIFPAIPGNKPTEVSCLSVHENLNFMAIGRIFFFNVQIRVIIVNSNCLLKIKYINWNTRVNLND